MGVHIWHVEITFLTTYSFIDHNQKLYFFEVGTGEDGNDEK
jgi:hypothetical protein